MYKSIKILVLGFIESKNKLEKPLFMQYYNHIDLTFGARKRGDRRNAAKSPSIVKRDISPL